MGARVRDLREAAQLSAGGRVPRDAPHSRGRSVAAARVRGPAHLHVHAPSRLAVQRRHRGDGGIVRACVRTRRLAGARIAGGAVPARGRELAGSRAHTHDPTAPRSAGLRAAPRAAVLLRRPGRHAERAERPPAVGGPVRDRALHPRALRAAPSETASTTVRVRRASARSSTASARSPRRSGCSSSGARSTTGSSRRPRSRRSPRSSRATAATSSSSLSRSSPTWR